MKKTKLILLSSIFLVYGAYDAMSSTAVAPKKIFTQAELEEEDTGEETSEARRDYEEKKRVRIELAAEIAEKQKELQVITKEEQEASRNAGAEGADRLKRKIAGHMDNIKATDDEIKQTTLAQSAEVKQLKEEKDAEIKEIVQSNAAVLKELNDKKALSMAKKAAREKELAALKGAKAPVAPKANQKALNTQIQAGKPLRKVNATVEPQASVAPQQVAAKSSGGFGALFGGLQAIQAQISQATDTATKISNAANSTIQNAAIQVDGIKEQVSGNKESVAGLVPSHSIKSEANSQALNIINI
ncbi:MAG: hypothetical protein NWS47_03825 [Alphaproteobacteria bacterium]|nr:hypothetical protein [Alphaproteobacteria bacterium]